MLPRVILDRPLKEGDVVALDPEQSHYILDVLRQSKGSHCELVVNNEGVFEGVVEDIKGKTVFVRVEKKVINQDVESNLWINVVMPFAKGERTWWAVQKLTELGVNRILFMRFERSVVWPKDRDHKLKRAKKVAIEAVRQCRRLRVPEIEILDNFVKIYKDDVLTNAGIDRPVIVFDKSGVCSFSRFVDKIKVEFDESGGIRAITLVVGPEGGFSQEELELFEQLKWKKVNLGRRILRVETAAVVGAALLQGFLGDF